MSYTATTKLTETESAALRRYLDEHGYDRACAQIGISKNTVYKALAGDLVARGTATLVRLAILGQAAQPESRP